MIAKYFKKITVFSIFIFLAIYQLFIINASNAIEWGLEMQPLELDMCDSVILHYDGKSWNPIYHKFNTWLDDIFGFDDNNIFAVGAQGAILHYDGKTWTPQENRANYRLNRIWGNNQKDVYVSGD